MDREAIGKGETKEGQSFNSPLWPKLFYSSVAAPCLMLEGRPGKCPSPATPALMSPARRTCCSWLLTGSLLIMWMQTRGSISVTWPDNVNRVKWNMVRHLPSFGECLFWITCLSAPTAHHLFSVSTKLIFFTFRNWEMGRITFKFY